MSLIEKLLQLQSIDQEIFQLKDAKDKLPKKIIKRNQEIQEVRQQANQMIDDIKRRSNKILDLQSEVDTHNAQITKLEEQLNQIASMQQCTEILAQIEQIKQKSEGLKSTLQERIDQNNAAKKKYQEFKQKMLAMEQEMNTMKQDAIKEQKKIENQLAETHIRRNKQKEDFQGEDAKMLEQYERVLVRSRIVLSPVEDGSCGYCHIELLPNQIATLSTGKILACKDCFRLMYMIIEEKIEKTEKSVASK